MLSQSIDYVPKSSSNHSLQVGNTQEEKQKAGFSIHMAPSITCLSDKHPEHEINLDKRKIKAHLVLYIVVTILNFV